jgi:hypothetical protein
METRRFLVLGLLALAGCGGGGVGNRRGARYNPGFSSKPWDRFGRFNASRANAGMGGGGVNLFRRRRRRR